MLPWSGKPCVHPNPAIRNCLWILSISPCGVFSGGGAEDAGIVLRDAAPTLKFLGIATQRIGLAHISDHALVLGVVDHRQRLLRGLAETDQRGAEIFVG